MEACANLPDALARGRWRACLAIAACLLGWWTLFTLGELLTAPEGLEHEILSFCGDLLGLAALALALITPWTKAQLTRAANRSRKRQGET